jgi:DNA primase
VEQKLLDLINEKTSIVDLVSEFVVLAKKGKNYMGLCPFHNEKTPSFSVSPEKNIAKCMGCGEGGSPINFYRKIKNLSLNDAAIELANRAGIEIKNQQQKQKDPNEKHYQMMFEAASFYQFNLKNSEKGQEALDYLYKRQMTDELINYFKLGYAPSYGNNLYHLLKDKGYAVSDMIEFGLVKQNDLGEYYDLFSDRVMFPITNHLGYVVGLSGRTLNKNDMVKYINSPETKIFKKGKLLYHISDALSEIRKTKQVILYEGFFDVISSYGAGIKNVCATMGTALTKDQAKLIKSVTNSIVVAFDGDQAGLKAIDHSIPILESEKLKVEVLMIPEKMDPDEFIRSYGPDKYEMLFGEFTSDAYQFRYSYYKMGKDLTNANDLKEFKKNIMDMIKYSDASIKSFYINKLSIELNIPLEDLTVKEVKQINKPTLPKNDQRPKMLNKYQKAERILLFESLRSKTVFEKIKNSLKTTDFADHLTASIRFKLNDYYDENIELDLNEFMDTLNLEQRDYLSETLLKDMFWISSIKVLEQDLNQYIDLVKEANLRRRLDFLNQKLSDFEENTESYIKERDQIKRQLMLKK